MNTANFGSMFNPIQILSMHLSLLQSGACLLDTQWHSAKLGQMIDAYHQTVQVLRNSQKLYSIFLVVFRIQKKGLVSFSIVSILLTNFCLSVWQLILTEFEDKRIWGINLHKVFISGFPKEFIWSTNYSTFTCRFC